MMAGCLLPAAGHLIEQWGIACIEQIEATASDKNGQIENNFGECCYVVHMLYSTYTDSVSHKFGYIP